MSRIFGLLWVVVCIGSLVVSEDAWANPGMEETRAVQVAPYNRGVDQVLRGIKSRVREASYSIRVTDLDEFILLEGEVDSERSRSEVVAAAQASTSKRVKDELRIRSAPSDNQIADHLRGALRQSHPRIADRVSVEVRNGVAYLSRGI
jgi:osmotically-inducible protein OsmY